ncbi:transposase [Bacteroides sp. ET225]|uniref:transposase n=1 Tax=Bacteroides sp. ET225 TaxID=2972461 RepID=UPI0021AD3B1B|nr:transposase [Bacteroides sp. ET225]MCR8918495.1 transposase [Bacteroides sp. ET225]
MSYNRKPFGFLDSGLEISETTYKADSWDKPRRIVMVRQEIEKRPQAAGKRVRQLELFEDGNDFGRYRYSCFVTNLGLPARIVYDSYRGRADSENRIKELKHDFSIDDFATNNFWATEACGGFIVMAYNFMSLFRHALINSDKKKFLKTIRYELISTPAYLGKTKDKHILYMARSLKTRQSFLSIWEKLKDFSLPYNTGKS